MRLYDFTRAYNQVSKHFFKISRGSVRGKTLVIVNVAILATRSGISLIWSADTPNFMLGAGRLSNGKIQKNNRYFN